MVATNTNNKYNHILEGIFINMFVNGLSRIFKIIIPKKNMAQYKTTKYIVITPKGRNSYLAYRI